MMNAPAELNAVLLEFVTTTWEDSEFEGFVQRIAGLGNSVISSIFEIQMKTGYTDLSRLMIAASLQTPAQHLLKELAQRLANRSNDNIFLVLNIILHYSNANDPTGKLINRQQLQNLLRHLSLLRNNFYFSYKQFFQVQSNLRQVQSLSNKLYNAESQANLSNEDVLRVFQELLDLLELDFIYSLESMVFKVPCNGHDKVAMTWTVCDALASIGRVDCFQIIEDWLSQRIVASPAEAFEKQARKNAITNLGRSFSKDKPEVIALIEKFKDAWE